MSSQEVTNVYWNQGAIIRTDRERLNGHRGCTIWFTGTSASGKSTLANATEKVLHEKGYHIYILDGDNIRHGLNKDLGFSAEDRTENIRRIGEMANLYRDSGIINLVAFISPYLTDRESARELNNNDGTFMEVFVNCPIEVCEQRDTKGIYKKARAGIIKDFTGISAPYEQPETPEIHMHTDKSSVEECVQLIITYQTKHGLIAR